MSESIRSPMTRLLGTCVAAVLISAPGVAAQTGTITGRVTDVQTGDSIPIARVQVYIANLSLGGLTQQNGRYLLQNVPAGTHTLNVTWIGYPTVQAQITVGRDRTVVQNFAFPREPIARPRPPTWPYWFAPTPQSVRPSKD